MLRVMALVYIVLAIISTILIRFPAEIDVENY
jgi:hypothetical protein